MALSGAKTWGGEFEVAGEPLPGWSLSGGYTYARTEESGGARGSFAINPLHVARVYTTYRLPGSLSKLTVGGGLNYQSEISQMATIPTGVFNPDGRSEEHTSELQSLMRISYAVFCLKKNNPRHQHTLHRKN